jgi:hypothetical protein
VGFIPAYFCDDIYLTSDSPVGAGFIPARKGVNVESTRGGLKASDIQRRMSNVEIRLKKSKKMRSIYYLIRLALEIQQTSVCNKQFTTQNVLFFRAD